MFKCVRLAEKWEFGHTETISIGDTVKFTCNGSGRGGHYNVTGTITKINRKTIEVTESVGSYKPKTPWRLQTSMFAEQYNSFYVVIK